MQYFHYVISELSNSLKDIDNELALESNNKELAIKKKKSYMEAIYLLKELGKFHFEDKKIDKIIEIPDIGYCDLRLVIDPETDDTNLWSEYKINGENIFLNTSDIIIKVS